MELPLPPPPSLCRSHATFLGPDPDPKAEKIVGQVLKAYGNLPFKGPVLELIPGVIAVEDMWEANLKDELMDRAEFGTVETFSLETWLKAKVDKEGTPDQQARLSALLNALPEPAPVVDSFGLPADIMNVVQQPLIEVSVYRDIDDIPVPDHLDDHVGPDDDDDDCDEQQQQQQS